MVVADHGPAIRAAARERLPRRFVCLDDARSIGVAGLELSLVAAMARLPGAALGLHGNDPGSCVVMAFPMRPPPP